MCSFSRVFSSSIARFARRRMAQRTLGTRNRSKNASAANTTTMTTSQSGRTILTDIARRSGRDGGPLIRYEAPPRSPDDSTRSDDEMSDLSPALDVMRRRSLLRGSTAGRWQRNLSGYAFGWPWFDGLSSWALRRFFFPASRLWAAAQVANGSPERFYQAAGIARAGDDGQQLARTLTRIETLRARAAAMEAEWQRVFFGPRGFVRGLSHRGRSGSPRRQPRIQFGAAIVRSMAMARRSADQTRNAVAR